MVLEPASIRETVEWARGAVPPCATEQSIAGYGPLPNQRWGGPTPRWVLRYPQSGAMEPPALRPLRILIVDDEPTIVLLVHRVLARDGHTVKTAMSIADGRALLRSEEFDVAVLDKNLPDGDGVALAELARGWQPRLGIVMITGYASLEALNARTGVIDACLRKPFHIRELAEKVTLAATRPGQRAGGTVESREPGTKRVLLLEPDVRECARLSRLVRSLGLAVEVATGVGDLDREEPVQAAVIASRCLDAEVRRKLWRRQGADKEFRLVVSSPERTVDDGVLAIGAGAAAHVVLAEPDGSLLYALGQAFGLSSVSAVA